ncbi:MAG: VOC family protein [Candidatus Thorarchaeota archaeon]
MLGTIRQIILYTANMQKQVEFYRDILGLKITYPDIRDYSKEFWVTFSTGEATLALHTGGKGEIGTDSPRFTFEVQDIQEAFSYFKDKGILDSEIREPVPNTFVFDIKDPEGNKISIEQFGYS